MNFLFTEDDMKEHLRWIVRHVASRLGIQDWEWLAAQELIEEIEKNSPDIYRKLEKYLTTYNDWYACSTKTPPGEPSEALLGLIHKRDALQKELTQILGKSGSDEN